MESATGDASAPSMGATETDDIGRHAVPNSSTSTASNTSNQSTVDGSDGENTVIVHSDSVGREDSIEATEVCVSGGDSQTEEGPSQLPPVPETSFEFQGHWKQLRNNQPLLISYFKVTYE